MKKLPYLLIVIIWFAIALVENVFPHLIDNKLFFWRTWEYVINNDGLGIDIIPFKPLQDSTFVFGGDYSRQLFFKSNKNELYSLRFITDEYGFRNEPYKSKKSLDVVLFGTSQVAGASETQSNLIASILEKKYNIFSYTYAKAQLQQFWNETRFKLNPPKYVVILGQDYEFMCKNYIIKLKNDNSSFSMISWTLEKWHSAFDSRDYRLLHKDYIHISDYVRRYSVLRIFSYTIFKEFINIIFDRSQLSDIFGNGSVDYDSSKNILFANSEMENPLLGSSCKTKKDLDKTVEILKLTKDILSKRGIKLIVGIMPSKSYLYSKKYSSIPQEMTAISHLDQLIDDAGIARIPLFESIYKNVRLSNNKMYYYPLDTHWNLQTNQLIAELINDKINNDRGR